MNPLVLLNIGGILIVIALGWTGLFASFPYGFGPWFLGRCMIWLDRDGLHWRRGRRVR